MTTLPRYPNRTCVTNPLPLFSLCRARMQQERVGHIEKMSTTMESRVKTRLYRLYNTTCHCCKSLPQKHVERGSSRELRLGWGVLLFIPPCCPCQSPPPPPSIQPPRTTYGNLINIQSDTAAAGPAPMADMSVSIEFKPTVKY